MIDINKKLQDHANSIIKQATLKRGNIISEELEEFVNTLIVLSLKQGFIWGIESIKQTSETLLNDIKQK